MSIETIEMPHLGESVTEASLSLWLVKEGDRVSRYEPIAEAVSDKVTTEIPSNYTGVVKALLIDTDTDVAIGTPIMTIETEATSESVSDSDSSKAANVRTEEFIDHLNEEIDRAGSQPIERTTEAAARQSVVQARETVDDSRRYSPAVMRISQERGIDLSRVEGTGKHGRITRKDVLTFESDTGLNNENLETSVVKTENLQVSRAEAPTAEHSEQAKRTLPAGQTVPADGIRKAIAKKMVQSTTEIPHAWMMVEADVTNIVALRNQTKEQFRQQEGLSLSYFPFFVKAVVQALKKHPVINSSWDEGNITYHGEVNLSIAVATDTHLFVPVIKHADGYSISGLSREIDRLASLARQGKLAPADMQGGTMTVNNTGSFGSVQSMGIINHPQAAILQVESINKRFMPTADGGFRAADMVNLCLSIDHRIIDGLQAGRFLQTVKENLARYSSEQDLY